MTRSTPCIAIVDDEAGQRELLSAAVKSAGFDTRMCRDGAEAVSAAAQCDLMLLDVRMPGMDGLQVLDRVMADHPGLPVVLLTAYIDVRDAVAAIRTGAFTYLEKPVDIDELIAVVEDALGLAVPPNDVMPPLPAYLIAESPAMRQILAQALRVADSDVSVLLLGESGVGKEVVAKFIHESSGRRRAPLVRVDCGALPDNLVESELFGHERGAFTGAAAQRKGQFELADRGTVFLDEVGELPLPVQTKFLHVLETGCFRRVGGSPEIHADARVVAATNRNLAAEVHAGRFREDLFYRLDVFSLTVPPLRERPDDILPLARHFIKARQKHLAPAAERMLRAYSWPGNVRELRNAMERSSLLANGALILPADLPPQLQQITAVAEPSAPPAGSMEEIHRRAILDALEKTGGNKTQAAALLGISRRNLVYKLRGYGL